MDIRLSELCEVSHVCQLTQAVHKALNEKLSDDEKADVQRWLQLVAQSTQAKVNNEKRKWR